MTRLPHTLLALALLTSTGLAESGDGTPPGLRRVAGNVARTLIRNNRCEVQLQMATSDEDAARVRELVASALEELGIEATTESVKFRLVVEYSRSPQSDTCSVVATLLDRTGNSVGQFRGNFQLPASSECENVFRVRRRKQPVH